LGASANVVVGAGKLAFAPYAVLGIGAHVLRVAGTSNATSPTFGARIGGGAHVQVRRVRVALEVAPTVLATSRGTADDVWLVRFRTFSLSAAFTP
jgi:hypothetical protein